MEGEILLWIQEHVRSAAITPAASGKVFASHRPTAVSTTPSAAAR